MRQTSGLVWWVSVLCLCSFSACEPRGDSTGSGASGGASGGGGMGGCLRVPQPTFVLTVLERDGGPLPPDTTVEIRWSAGDEPAFHLDQPHTWPSLDDAGYTCDIDPSLPPPADFSVLTCALWTASPTEVRVSAIGYETEEKTYVAETTADCDMEPTPIEIELGAKPPQ